MKKYLSLFAAILVSAITLFAANPVYRTVARDAVSEATTDSGTTYGHADSPLFTKKIATISAFQHDRLWVHVQASDLPTTDYDTLVFTLETYVISSGAVSGTVLDRDSLVGNTGVMLYTGLLDTTKFVPEVSVYMTVYYRADLDSVLGLSFGDTTDSMWLASDVSQDFEYTTTVSYLAK